jgi:transcriptional regulator with XRE-family HTH domain
MRDRLKKMRKLRGLNYSELGRLAGVSHTAIQKLENGRTSAGIETAEKE